MNIKVRKKNLELGGAMVEAAVSISILLMILLSGVEFLVYCYKKSAVDLALSQTGRYAVLGVSQAGTTRAELIKTNLIETSAKFGVSLSNSDITVGPVNAIPVPAPCTDTSAGCGNDWVYITARYSADYFALLPNITTTRKIFVRNEPF